MHLDWQKREVIKALMKKRYEMAELKRSNIFLKAYNLNEWICSFDTRNFLMSYGAVKEKFGVKLLFTAFQQLVLRLLKLPFF